MEKPPNSMCRYSERGLPDTSQNAQDSGIIKLFKAQVARFSCRTVRKA